MNRVDCVAYVRVSTDKQADHGLSLDAQREKIASYAALYDLTIRETIVDAGMSAKSLDRPGLTRALGMLGQGAGKVQGIIVVKLDRLTRSVRDLGDLVERYFGADGAALLSVGEQIDTRSAGGRLVLNVLASVSQWEREAIGERTTVVMRLKASRGEYCGGNVPYGHRLVDGGILVPDEAEQRVIAYARELRGQGYSYARIGYHLARNGMTPRDGQTWAPTQVSRLL